VCVCVPVVERDEVTSQPLVIDLVLLVQDQEYQVEPDKHKLNHRETEKRKPFIKTFFQLTCVIITLKGKD
jgi:hypothetical protein